MARKRELIDPNKSDKQFVRRDESGRFSERTVQSGRTLTQRVTEATERVIRQHKPALDYLRDK
jgi:hypothetical protein